MLRDRLRDALFEFDTLYRIWSAHKRRTLLADYRARRERYARIAASQRLQYSAEQTRAEVRSRLADRGYSPSPRALGDVHTFAFVPRISWHSSLFPDLERLGPLTVFDYTEHGHEYGVFNDRSDQAVQLRRDMLKTAFSTLQESHRRQPVDWVFVYAHGGEVSRCFIERIVDEIGIPVVNMCLDDKQSWSGHRFDRHRIGQIDIAGAFDLSWTSARVACEWYLCEGARPLYMPEGFDCETFHPLELPSDIPVSFVGGGYGFRRAVVSDLRRHGVPIQVYGAGWRTQRVSPGEQAEIINRSCINLGMGGIGYAETLTNVKGRDFEIPGAGGGMYLTSFNPDLAQHFHIGEEIVCYRNQEEMVELIRHYLARPEERQRIAGRAYSRCLKEHRWLHRYMEICRTLGVLSESVGAPRTDLSHSNRVVAPEANTTKCR